MKKNITMELPEARIGNKGGFLKILAQSAICFVLAVVAMLYIVFSGVGAAQPAIVDTLLGAETDAVSELDVAEAGSNSSGGSVGTITQDIWANGSGSDYINGTYSVSYTANPGGNLYRHFYFEGNSCNTNYSTGGGSFGVYGSGTVRQKEIVFGACVYIRLNGILATLANNSKLQISSASATLSSTDGYDQDIKWGVASGAQSIANNGGAWSSPSVSIVGGSYATSKSGKSETRSGTPNITVNSTTVTIQLLARTNYTSWVGGRWPAAGISNISLTFKTLDSSGPGVNLTTDLSSWSTSKTLSFTITEPESGTSMYTISNGSGYTGSYSAPYYTVSNVKGGFSGAITFYNRSYKSTSTATYTAAQLKIDTTAPNVSEGEFITTAVASGGTNVGGTNVNNVVKEAYYRCTVSDPESGLKSVVLKNTATNASVSAKAISGSTYIFGPLPANGTYQVTATNNANTPKSNTAKTIEHLDLVAPTVKCDLDTNISSGYIKNAVKATFTIVERADEGNSYTSSNYQTLHKLPDIGGFGVMYNGATLEPSGTPTSNYANCAWTYTYVYYFAKTGKYTFYAKDAVGNNITSTTSAGTNLAAGKSSIEPLIDTTAPFVSAVTATDTASTDVANRWSNKGTTLNITVKDYCTAYDTYNNFGSEVCKLEVYGKKGTTETLLHTYLSAAGTDTATVTYKVNFDNPVQYTLKHGYDVYPKYTWKVYDNAGNSSDLKTGSGPRSGGTALGTEYTNYYNNNGNTPAELTVYYDPNTVNLTVKNGSTVISSSGNSSVMAWTKDENTELSLLTTFGPSGAIIECAVGDSGYGILPSIISDSKYYPVTRFQNTVNYKQYDIDGVKKYFPENNNSNNNLATNSTTLPYTCTGPGATVYRFRITSGAGAVFETGTITVRRDTSDPTVTLLGFGTYNHSNSVSSQEGIIANIESFISESNMSLKGNVNGIPWYNKEATAIIMITDGDDSSGLKSEEQVYIENGVQKRQPSKAYGTLEFSFKGYTYSDNNLEYKHGNGVSILTVRMWNIADVKNKAKKNGVTGLINSSNGLTAGAGEDEPFTYKIKVSDFAGNVSEVKNGANSAELKYNVDPFILNFDLGSVVAVAASEEDEEYSATPTGGFTRKDIKITINKTAMGLSATTVSYYCKTLTATKTNGTDIITGYVTSMDKNDSKWVTAPDNTGTATSATMLFTASSRIAQVIIKLGNQTDNVAIKYQFNNKYVVLKQDIDAPNMDSTTEGTTRTLGFFFSASKDLTSPYLAATGLGTGTLSSEVMAFYKTEKVGQSYTATRTFPSTDTANIWTHQGAYLYVLVSDGNGSGGMGSGIDSVQCVIEDKIYDLVKVNSDASTFIDLYRIAVPATGESLLGYVTTEEAYGISLTIKDAANNSESIALEKAKVGNNNYKLFPVIDDTIPTVSLKSVTAAGVEIEKGKLKMSENGITNDLTFSIDVKVGVSGVKIYFKQSQFKSNNNLLNANISTYMRCSETLVATSEKDKVILKESSSEWKWYEFVPGQALACEINGKAATRTVSVKISKEQVIKNQLNILIVTGAGAYYYLNAGDVFIDATAPKIWTDSIFYTLVSKTPDKGTSESDPVAYSELVPALYIKETIKDNSTVANWANDEIYAYLKVTDINGSGVDYVKSGSDEQLTKMYIKLSDDTEEINQEYYRIKLVDCKAVTVTATDKSGNTYDASNTNSQVSRTQVSVNIDNKAPAIAVNVSYEDTNETYRLADGSYTNRDLKLVIKILSGASGCNVEEDVWFAVNDNNDFSGATYKSISEIATYGTIDAYEYEETGTDGTGGTGGTTTITVHLNRQFNKYFSFKAQNGVKYYKGTERPTAVKGGINEPMRIAIDKTKPIYDITKSTVKNAEGVLVAVEGEDDVYTTKSWYKEGISIGIYTYDKEDSDSGIKEVKVSYKVRGVSMPNATAEGRGKTDTNCLYKLSVNGYELSYENYTDYVVTISDYAGNISRFTIRPKIDKTVPQIMHYETNIIDANSNTTSYRAGSWTNGDVVVSMSVKYSISGVTLQRSSRAGENEVWSSWTPLNTSQVQYSYGSFTTADDGQTKTDTITYTFAVGINEDSNREWKFRLITGSTVPSEEKEIGYIKIDKNMPKISIDVKSGANSIVPNYATKIGDYTIAMNKWLSEDLMVIVESKNTNLIVSDLYFKYEIDGQVNTAKVSDTGNYMYEEGKADNQYTAKFRQIINTNTDNSTFTYWFESGSGMKSSVCTFSDIKVDKTQVSISPSYKASSTVVANSEGREGKLPKISGENAWTNTGNIAYENNTWTSKDSVIIRLAMEVPISGLSLYVSGIKVDNKGEFVLDNLNSKQSDMTEVNKGTYLYNTYGYQETEIDDHRVVEYLVINNASKNLLTYFNPKTKKFELCIRIESGSGKKSQDIISVGIDNVIPMFYIESIEGTKSSNWDNSTANSWYTSEVTVKFKVGTLVKDTATNKWVFSDTINDSGYMIGYKIIRQDSTIGHYEKTTEITISDCKDTEYVFGIKSNAGIEYELGGPSPSSDNIAAGTIRDNILKVKNPEGVKHLAQAEWRYLFNVDTTVYTFTHPGILEFTDENGAKLKDDRENSFVTYTVKILDNDNNEIGDGDGNYRHGDMIKISYESDRSNGYYVRLFEYGSYDGKEFGADIKKISTDSATEAAGTLLQGNKYTYQFVDSNLRLNAYIVKELTVEYENTVMYLQSESTPKTKATATYSNNKDIDIKFTLDIDFKTCEGGDIPTLSGTNVKKYDVGGYIIRASIRPVKIGEEDGVAIYDTTNQSSFRLKNAEEMLLVKYFDGDAQYTIKSAKDFEYISKVYYSEYSADEEGNFTLGEAHKYSDGNFVINIRDGAEAQVTTVDLSADVKIPEFGGTLDGNNVTLRIPGGITSKDFGFIGVLTGTVQNLGIEVVGDVIVEGNANVGALAAVIDGGKAMGVRTDMTVVARNTASGSNIGGLVGKANGNVGIGNVFADVYVEAKGIASGNIGGLIGYADLETTAVIEGTYTYGHIVAYEVNNEVKVGTLIGRLNSAVGVGSIKNNLVIENNAFVKDERTSSIAGNVELADTAATAVSHSNFIGSSNMGEAGYNEVAGKHVRFAVLDKIYRTFYDEQAIREGYTLGNGADEPLVITTAAQLRKIDRYVNLNYRLDENIDLERFSGGSIALHQIFGGEFDGDGREISNISNKLLSDGNDFGLFAAVSGHIKGLKIRDAEIFIETDSDTLYAGVIAGRLLGGKIDQIYVIGTLDIVGNGPKSIVYAGAIAGYAKGGQVYDIFSVTNVKTEATVRAVVGGIFGMADNTVLGGETSNGALRTVYSLGRVEVKAESPEYGAVLGAGSLNNVASKAIYAIKDNVYSNGDVKNDSGSIKASMVTFDDSILRSSTFSDGTGAFSVVFGEKKLYYIDLDNQGKFIVTNVAEFLKIEHMLYASYNIKNDIVFDNDQESTAFKTIGKGLKFTGSIDGKNENSWSAEDGKLSSLLNMTDALVYENAGSITDIGLNVYYNKTVTRGESVEFGAVAIRNSTGTLRNITVSGEITIIGATKYGTEVTVSGFVGVGLGGTFASDSKFQNSISGLAITIRNIGTVYAGGYIGRIEGPMTLSYGIGNGTIDIRSCGTTYAGKIAGGMMIQNAENEIITTQEYSYTVKIDGITRSAWIGREV